MMALVLMVVMMMAMVHGCVWVVRVCGGGGDGGGGGGGVCVCVCVSQM